MAVKITKVDEGSPAWRAGIRPGQTLVSLNKNNITDVLDYRFYMTDSRLDILLMNEDRTMVTVAVQKEEYEDLGLEFETYLMDRQMGCRNKCIFCFVDQMPPGMRQSLYFKDDDTRMSFLFGNYTTLTNLKEEDIRRIIKLKVSPINVSVHTTDPRLRVRMMGNPTAGEKLRFLSMLAEGGIALNTQLVLCPGYNDGAQLERSLRDLAALTPAVRSIAVVPVGLTKYRQKLTPLRTYEPGEALQVVRQVEAWGDVLEKKTGRRTVYASDEFYLKAGLSIPPASFYGDFDQLDNGVGLVALLEEEFGQALNLADGADAFRATVATGEAAFPLLSSLAERVMARFPQVDIQVRTIRNDFFGRDVTVAGLVTGQDLLAQLKGLDLGEKLLIPSVMLRHEQDKFLDDTTLEQVRQTLSLPVQVVENDGYQLLDAMTIRDF